MESLPGKAELYDSTFADPAQLQRMALLCGTNRPFAQSVIAAAGDGENLACTHLGESLYAIPEDRLADAKFGPFSERLFWLIHSQVRCERSVEITFPYEEIQHRLFGHKKRNWLAQLLKAFRALSHLQIGEWREGEVPPLDRANRLFDEIRQENNPNRFTITIGKGFLGALDEFTEAVADGGQISVPATTQLKRLNKQQKIQDVFLPVYLGDPLCLRELALSSRQKRLLQAVIRELTFPKAEKGARKTGQKNLETGELIIAGHVPDYRGSKISTCPDLDQDRQYVSFNGNGLRRGQGYLLKTWQDKAGYRPDERQLFLKDLQVLAEKLHLVVTAIRKSGEWCGHRRLRVIACDISDRRRVSGYHVRIYAPATWHEDWKKLCGWEQVAGALEQREAAANRQLTVLDEVRVHISDRKWTQQKIAREIGVSKQALSKSLKHNHCSARMEDKLRTFLSDRTTRPGTEAASDPAILAEPGFIVRRPRVEEDSSSMRFCALDYHRKGWTVIPVERGTKKPLIRWKEYQTRQPRREDVENWWTTWPNANIAVVLGSTSNLAVVDVDGREPHRILLDLCGEIPLAPTVKSGSDDPFRYHLYFKHPANVRIGARKTPWNQHGDPEKLEIKGQGGILVLPPSIHPSGKRYGWVSGRSLRQVNLDELPVPLLNGLQLRTANKDESLNAGVTSASSIVVRDSLQVAASTAEFLAGKFAASGGWNNRLFRAACDLNSQKIPLPEAKALLLRGACPETVTDRQFAEDTIASAFSRPRTRGQF